MAKPKKPEKRQRILKAALNVFAERGFYNAKVSEVARRAGVADGTIYLYFKNKDDLLIKLFEDRMDRINKRLRIELEILGGDVITRIRRMMELHIRLAEDDPQLAELITVEARQSTKFIKEYNNPRFLEYLSILRSLVEEGQRNGELRNGIDSRIVVRAIFGALDELLLTLTLTAKSRSIDFKEAAGHISDLFINGIVKSKEKK